MSGPIVYAKQDGTNVTLTTTTETVVAHLSGVTTPRGGLPVVINAVCQLLVGTGATGLTPRIRRGKDATGTLVSEGNQQAVTGAAGSVESVSLMAVDNPPDMANGDYVLTIGQVGATGNGTGEFSSISATISQ